ncbi:MAG: hypothetical protein ACI8QS_001548 [Planctomycetota bacterium]|jgi:hypothetical protein
MGNRSWERMNSAPTQVRRLLGAENALERVRDLVLSELMPGHFDGRFAIGTKDDQSVAHIGKPVGLKLVAPGCRVLRGDNGEIGLTCILCL